MTDSKQSSSNELVLIEIEKVISSKNPKLLKQIPKFIVRYLKRIVHQEEINEFLTLNRDKMGLDFVTEAIKFFEVKYSVKGVENIGQEKYVFASNHPLGGLDGLIITDTIGKIHPNLRNISNDFLMNVPNTRKLFIPVNKVGKQSVNYAKGIEDMFLSDAQITFFPAGLVSRKIDGEIIDLEWKKSFIQKAIKHKRDIIPIYCDGQNSRFFYNLAKLRGFLKIKFNIEMLYLPNELFKQKGKELHLTIGKPIPYQIFDKSKRPLEWAQLVKKLTYRLEKEPDLELKDII